MVLAAFQPCDGNTATTLEERQARDVLWGRELPAVAQWLFVELWLRRSKVDGNAKGFVIELAYLAWKHLGSGSESAIRRALARLEAEGLVRRVGQNKAGEVTFEVLRPLRPGRQRTLFDEEGEESEAGKKISAPSAPSFFCPPPAASAADAGWRSQEEAMDGHSDSESSEKNQTPIFPRKRLSLAEHAAAALGDLPESPPVKSESTARELRFSRSLPLPKTLPIHILPQERGEMCGGVEDSVGSTPRPAERLPPPPSSSSPTSPATLRFAPRPAPDDFLGRFTRTFDDLTAKLRASRDGRSRPVYGWIVAFAAEQVCLGDGGKVLGWFGDAVLSIKEGRTRHKDLGRLFVGWLKSPAGFGGLPKIKPLKLRLIARGVVWNPNWDAEHARQNAECDGDVSVGPQARRRGSQAAPGSTAEASRPVPRLWRDADGPAAAVPSVRLPPAED